MATIVQEQEDLGRIVRALYRAWRGIPRSLQYNDMHLFFGFPDALAYYIGSTAWPGRHIGFSLDYEYAVRIYDSEGNELCAVGTDGRLRGCSLGPDEVSRLAEVLAKYLDYYFTFAVYLATALPESFAREREELFEVVEELARLGATVDPRFLEVVEGVSKAMRTRVYTVNLGLDKARELLDRMAVWDSVKLGDDFVHFLGVQFSEATLSVSLGGVIIDVRFSAKDRPMLVVEPHLSPRVIPRLRLPKAANALGSQFSGWRNIVASTLKLVAGGPSIPEKIRRAAEAWLEVVNSVGDLVAEVPG